MTPDARVQELLPCPWCLKTNTRVKHSPSQVECRDCGAEGPTHRDPISAWNDRSTPETERLRSALREARWYVREIKRLRDGFRFESPDADALLTTIDSLLTPTRDPR